MVDRVASKGYVRSSNLLLMKRTATHAAASAGAAAAQVTTEVAMAVSGNAEALMQQFDQRAEQIQRARLKGYEGDSCPDCGNFTLVRNGTCLKCDTCGSTTGCS
jgi:ribonucleoside-diphosphate reductase alpha chain